MWGSRLVLGVQGSHVGLQFLIHFAGGLVGWSSGMIGEGIDASDVSGIWYAFIRIVW